MPARIIISSQTASGEQVQIDVCQWNPVTGDIEHDSTDAMIDLGKEYMCIVDERKAEMHQRMLQGYGLRQYCTPEEWYKISCVLDIIAGHMDGETVARRWQSSIEENAALAEGREAAYAAEMQEG